MATQTNNAPPVEVLRDGALKASIWKNTGENGIYFTTKFAKTYEKDGTLHDIAQFSSRELLVISELARQAYLKEIFHRATSKQ